mmetsp:Transcript_78082/g.135435  ORF Transcript_78082/g.135435 Transcript_78082/m.135435 type:complete len:273 (-) Transcript_78082:223-1041(-)
MKFSSFVPSGPGWNLCSFSASTGPVNCTIMQVMLSFEFLASAFCITASAAAAGSFFSRRLRAASSTTSGFAKSPSETPSQTIIKKSVLSHSNVPSSGSAVTTRSSRLGPVFKLVSPNPRDTARSPLTLATPMPPVGFATVPPQRMMRASSEGWSGLWSTVRPWSVPPPSTMAPSILPRSTLLSPALATRNLYLPSAAAGASTMHMAPVEPLSASRALNSSSTSKIIFLTASSFSGNLPISSSFSLIFSATNFAHRSPPWPSNTPKKPQPSLM